MAFSCPTRCYMGLAKSGGSPRRQIVGLITDDVKDLQGDTLLQRGLDFQPFLDRWGFFNNDHGKKMDDVVGVPDRVEFVPAGERLPDGTIATADCTWCEGTLTNDKDGDAIWSKALALQDLGRGLGFSVEGEILERSGPGGKTISKARVHHVAITHQPVNRNAVMGQLLRSLAVGLGQPGSDGPVLPGTYGGASMGRALQLEDLDPRITCADVPASDARKKRRKAKKSPASGMALESIYRALPGVSPEFALALLARLSPNDGLRSR